MTYATTQALRELSLPEIIERLRRAGHTWFRNDDLLLLEELIRRVQLQERLKT